MTPIKMAGAQRTLIEELMNNDSIICISAATAARVMKVSPQALREMARSDTPDRLGFPVLQVGKRVLIPKKPFLESLGFTN